TLGPAITKAAEAHNAAAVGKDGKPKGPRFEPVPTEPPAGPPPEGLPALSDRVRRGDLYAFVENPAGVDRAQAAPEVRCHSGNPHDDALRDWLTGVVNDQVRAARFRTAGVDRGLADRLSRPVPVENLGLLARASGGPVLPGATGAGAGAIKAAEKVDPV